MTRLTLDHIMVQAVRSFWIRTIPKKTVQKQEVMMAILTYHIEYQEHQVNNVSEREIEECIGALDDVDRSGSIVHMVSGGLFITGGADGLVMVRYRPKDTNHPMYYWLVQPELFNDKREVLLSIMYQQSAVPICAAIPKDMAVQAALSCYRRDWLAEEYYWAWGPNKSLEIGAKIPKIAEK